jgi:hypothetical protein
MYSPVSLCKTLFTVPPFPAPKSPTTLRSSSLSSGNPWTESDPLLPLFSDFFLVFLTVDLDNPFVPPLASSLLPGREDDDEISMLASSRSISARLDMECEDPGLGMSPSPVVELPGASGAVRVDLIPNPAGFFFDTLEATLGGISVCPEDGPLSCRCHTSSSTNAAAEALGVGCVT